MSDRHSDFWLGASYVVSHPWHRLHDFPHLTPVTWFPALGTGYMFPTLGVGYMISHTWHRLHDFPHLAPVTCFPHLAPVTWCPTLGTGNMISHTWHRLHDFPHLGPFECFCFKLWLVHWVMTDKMWLLLYLHLVYLSFVLFCLVSRRSTVKLTMKILRRSLSSLVARRKSLLMENQSMMTKKKNCTISTGIWIIFPRTYHVRLFGPGKSHIWSVLFSGQENVIGGNLPYSH